MGRSASTRAARAASHARPRSHPRRSRLRGSTLRLFADTSALVKLLVAEPGSDEIRALVSKTSELQVARIAFVEAHSALVRAQVSERLTAEDADEARSRFARLWSAAAVIELDAVLAEHAAALARAHALRAYNAVQLASALEARGDQPLSFACFDEELAGAARGEGLGVEPA